MSSGIRRTFVFIDAGTAVSIIGVGGVTTREEDVLEGLNSWAAKLKVSVYLRFVSPFVGIADCSIVVLVLAMPRSGR